jgi:undecaprenyl diphosphate synthase
MPICDQISSQLQAASPIDHAKGCSACKKQLQQVPAHVGVIMDGNRRWAMQRGLPAAMGHLKGAENLLEIVEAASEAGVEVLTLFSFSTENWKRDPEEVEHLFQMMQDYLVLYRAVMIQKGVRLRAIGDLTQLPWTLQQALEETLKATSHGTTIDLVLAINYGGRNDIVRAVQRVAELVQEGQLSVAQINEGLFSQILDTGQMPDPDLIIRTSGELRLSNFMLWQSGYAEILPVDVLWPDFSKAHFSQALQQYQDRKRRHGR